jgi:hypothetical protein
MVVLVSALPVFLWALGLLLSIKVACAGFARICHLSLGMPWCQRLLVHRVGTDARSSPQDLPR